MACREPIADTIELQAEGERTFARDRAGRFSALFPCSPKARALPKQRGEATRVQLGCDSEGQALSLTVIPSPAPAVPPSEQLAVVYATAIGELEDWREQARTAAALRRWAGRTVQYVELAAIDGGVMAAHVWFFWAPEQQTLYQVMAVGRGDERQGEAVMRSLLVPSP